MQQCPKCKCQFGSNIAVCPYCGTHVPVEEPYSDMYAKPWKSEDDGRTHIQYHHMHSATQTVQRRAAEPAIYPEVQGIVYYTLPYGMYTERENNQSTVLNILIVLITCLAAVNIFEFVALLLCMR
jgi:hypothetical protein